MIRKTFRTGNSVVVSLPKDAIKFLNIEAGSQVGVELDREKRQIVITPVEPSQDIKGVDAEFAHQVSEFIQQYRAALDELAK